MTYHRPIFSRKMGLCHWWPAT